MKNSHLSDKKFSDFDLPEAVLAGLESAGFEFCTEIQSLTLPVALKGTDIAGQAQTGTGKTLAFLIATFTHLLRKPKPSDDKKNIRTLILAPTRELAIQIHADAKKLGAEKFLKLGLAYGGVDYEKQRNEIEAGVDILIGTPGRIIDYFKQGVFSLKEVEVIVLDEADRMFDLGFIADIRFLMRRAPEPKDRLSLLFSATLSQRVLELAYEHMNEPENISQQVQSITAANITERLYLPATDEKMALLAGLLRAEDPSRAMVFINTKHVAERIQRTLAHNGFSVDMLSGDVRQSKRQTILKRFQEGKLKVLVATDVAARGLHIDDVTHVINYDLPANAEDYVHRIGRTARAGASGEAISFACEEYAIYQMDIEDYIKRKIPSSPINSEILAELERPPRRESTGDRGKARNPRGRGRDPSSSERSNRQSDRHADRKPRKPTPAQTTDTAPATPEQSETRNSEQQPRPRRNRNRNRNRDRNKSAAGHEAQNNTQQDGVQTQEPRNSRRRKPANRNPRQDNNNGQPKDNNPSLLKKIGNRLTRLFGSSKD